MSLFEIMTYLYKPITLILEFYYMSNSQNFQIFNIILRIFYRLYALEMACLQKR